MPNGTSAAAQRDSLAPNTLVRLAILAGATFIYVTFEVFPVGLISDIARDLGQSESRIGLLISGYAVVAAVVTIPSVALASRISRGSALILSLVALIIAELMTYVAGNYAAMVVSRVIAALMHGVLWSLVAPAAAALVPARKIGVATAIVFAGPAMAAILGSPGTTLIGRTVGWRNTALLLAIATVVITVGVWWAVRPQPGSAATRTAEDGASAPSDDTQTSAADRTAVWSLCGLTLVLVTAHFVSFTYFALIIEHVTRSGNSTVTFLAIFGVAGAAATYLVGRYTDLAPHRTAVVTFAAFLGGALLLVVSELDAPAVVRYAALAAAVIAWGGAYAGAGPVLQSGVIRVAGPEQDRASSVYVTSYQIGIAAGSGLGAALLGQSVGVLPWITAGLAFTVIAYAATPRSRRTFQNP